MFGDKLKSLIDRNKENSSGNDKKKIENLVFLVVLLIITVVAINIVWNGNKEKSTKQEINDKTKKLASDTVIETSAERKYKNRFRRKA